MRRTTDFSQKVTFFLAGNMNMKNVSAKSEQAVNAARRQGMSVDTTQKWGAATNKQHQTSKNTAKLDRETDELKHDKISMDIINDYEAGRAIPNQAILGKIERTIGVKLRGQNKGENVPGAAKK
ncbi:Hypothetical predicted protein [Cloeon dipterum]|uniref:Multiprotein bridging factor 1 N-terminal domain-containing protein n=1 Tax=Cloeon dipterum TaxID=197152 RepID=A0A8S1C9U0_9INSE|nr:Hypothetical predicted protein [Cloeon dipterum]